MLALLTLEAVALRIVRPVTRTCLTRTADARTAKVFHSMLRCDTVVVCLPEKNCLFA
jgi:hypothetical protein